MEFISDEGGVLSTHKVYRVSGFLYPVVRIGSPYPLTRKRVMVAPFGPKRGGTISSGGGREGPNSDDRTDTLEL
jgi:hypothetical protein